MEILPIQLIILFIVGLFIFVVFTKRGKGVLFDGKVLKTLDREIKQTNGRKKSRIRVHLIEKNRDNTKAIGVELTEHAYLAWNMTPINLTMTDAKELISMLQEVVHDG